MLDYVHSTTNQMMVLEHHTHMKQGIFDLAVIHGPILGAINFPKILSNLSETHEVRSDLPVLYSSLSFIGHAVVHLVDLFISI